MNLKHIKAVFRKDAIELIRDKRTWFVNIVLPVLLYPVLAVIGIQVFQITQPGPEDLPVLGIYEAPPELRTLLQDPDKFKREAANKKTAENEHAEHESDDAEATDEEASTQAQKNDAVIRPSIKIESVSHSEAATFLRYINLVKQDEKADVDQAALEEQKQASLETLSQLKYSAVLICQRSEDQYHNWHLELVANNAHRDYLKLSQHVNKAVSVYRKRLLKNRLEENGFTSSFTQPAQLKTNNLASIGESVRTHFLAGFLPVILVLMVIVGTFHPAPDLIAGERERGTLETLLAWPSDRQSIFVGKLLVVIAATIATVVLNLGSLSITASILGSQIPAGANNKITALSEIVSVGPMMIMYCFIALFPITILIATLSLAVAGLAKSYKEAQNYLSPMVILFTMPAMLCLLPHIKPHILLDLIPLIGPLVALKACLQNADMAVVHLMISTAASIGISAMVVSWATTLLNKEQFLFPNIKNMGWRQLKQWRNTQSVPGGLEVMLLFAAVLGGFLASSVIFSNANTLIKVIGPLIFSIGLPSIIFVYALRYSPKHTLFTNKPTDTNWLWAFLLIPLSFLISMSLGNLQAPFMPENDIESEMIREIINTINEMGGLPLMILCMAIVPGITEELLCRGVLLSGFRKSLGPRYAILMSAFLFAVLHMSPYRFVPQFVLGIFLAVIVLRSHSIWLAMLVHAGHNALVLILQHVAENDPEIARMIQEQASQGLTVNHIYGFIGTFIVTASIAAGICMLIKPPPEKELAQD